MSYWFFKVIASRSTSQQGTWKLSNKNWSQAWNKLVPRNPSSHPSMNSYLLHIVVIIFIVFHPISSYLLISCYLLGCYHSSTLFRDGNPSFLGRHGFAMAPWSRQQRAHSLSAAHWNEFSPGKMRHIVHRYVLGHVVPESQEKNHMLQKKSSNSIWCFCLKVLFSG